MEYAIQARLIERRGSIVVRDETRRDIATVLSDAVRVARAHAADGFTVWIYEVHRDDGVRPTYVTVDTFRPQVAPPSDADARLRQRTRPPQGRP